MSARYHLWWHIVFALGAACLLPICAVTQSNYKIAGLVVNAFTDAPIPRAEVSIGLNKAGPSLQDELSGDDGRFTFENVSAGKYVLTATRRGFGTQLYQQHQSYSTAIVVGPGKNSEQIIFRVTPAGSISGRVSDESDESIRGAIVMLWSQNTRDGVRRITSEMNTQTDEQGNYHFSHLAPGSYYVEVDGRVWYQSERQVAARQQGVREGRIPRPADHDPIPDVVFPLTFFPNTTNFEGAQPVIVRGGDAQTADVTLSAVRAIHLRFSSPGRDPSQFPGVQVMRSLFGTAQNFIQADVRMVSSGMFEIANLYPGHFKFAVQVQGPNEQIEESGEMDVADDGMLELARNTQMSSLSGEVVLSGPGRLQPAGMVRIRNLLTGKIHEDEVETNGHFEFPENLLQPGTYLVTVRNGETLSVPAVSGSGGKVSGNTVQIGTAQAVHLLLSISGQSYSLNGVAMREGKPAEGMRIVLVPKGAENDSGFIRFEQSDSDGSFAFFSLAVGTYTILALADAWDLEWATPGALDKYLPGGTVIQVGAGAQKTVEVKVQ